MKPPDTDQPVVTGRLTDPFLVGAWIWIIGIIVMLFLVAHAIRSDRKRIEVLETQHQEQKR